MRPDEEVADLVKSAIECEPAERHKFLEANCRPELRAEVESLLAHQESLDGFMETPALHLAAESLTQQGAFSIGEIVGNYEIISLIGKGGMGEVYLAQDRKLNRRVALKLVRRGMDTDSIVRRFLHEQQLLASLNHPQIAQLYEAGVNPDGVPFFAMEHVDGTRIDDYCRAKNLSVAQRLELFSKVCAAVHYAHQRLVVHRDIKPSNILVTADGEPKLLDFGIAKLVDAVTNVARPEHTITLQNVLTPDYASPEHVRGEPITTASDVYSLGVLLYELLTGAKPYRIETRTPVEIARVISEREPAKPSAVAIDPNRKSLWGDLDNIVLMAMRKEPQRRYSSVAQFATDVRRHLDRLPVIARKDTVAYRSSKFVRRHRVGVAAAILVLLTLVAGLIGTAWEARRARDEGNRATVEARKTNRINQFLQTMLSFSDQSIVAVSPVAHKKDATVREMLDQIAPRIDAELADEPEVRVQVLRTIGSAYASQGQYDEAEKHLRAALATQTQLHGENNAEAAATMLELGVLTFRQFRLEEADRLLEKAVAFYRSLRGTSQNSPVKLALALEYLGDVKGNSGDTKSALALMKEALETSSGANLQGAERAVVALNKGDLGALLVTVGQNDQGELLLREAVEDFRRISNQSPWELGGFITMLGVAALNKNNLDEAQKDLGDGERIYRQTLGERSGYLVYNLNQQAVLLYKRKEVPAAENRALEALAVARSIGGGQLMVAGVLRTLGDILLTENRANEAESYYREALSICEQTPAQIGLAVTVKMYLSRALLAQNRADEATRTASEAEQAARQHLGPEDPLTKTAGRNLAIVQKH